MDAQIYEKHRVPEPRIASIPGFSSEVRVPLVEASWPQAKAPEFSVVQPVAERAHCCMHGLEAAFVLEGYAGLKFPTGGMAQGLSRVTVQAMLVCAICREVSLPVKTSRYGTCLNFLVWFNLISFLR